MTTISLSAKKTTEQIAKRAIAEMTEVMSLSKKKSAKVLAIIIDKINKTKELRAETKGNKEAFKKWKIDHKSKEKLIKTVGKNNFNTWKEYYKAKVAKRKRINN